MGLAMFLCAWKIANVLYYVVVIKDIMPLFIMAMRKYINVAQLDNYLKLPKFLILKWKKLF